MTAWTWIKEHVRPVAFLPSKWTGHISPRDMPVDLKDAVKKQVSRTVFGIQIKWRF